MNFSFTNNQQLTTTNRNRKAIPIPTTIFLKEKSQQQATNNSKFSKKIYYEGSDSSETAYKAIRYIYTLFI
jgi:hypothetical protein